MGAGVAAVRAAMVRAIEIFGSEKALGRKAGYSQYSIWRAKTYGRCTGEMANRIEHVTGGQVSKEELAPQVFCTPPKRRRRNFTNQVAAE